MASFLTQTYFGNTILQYLYFFGTLLGAYILGKIIYYISKHVIRKITAKTKNKFDDILVNIMEQPLIFILLLGGIYWGKDFLTLSERISEIFTNGILMWVILLFAWIVTYFIDALLLTYASPIASKTKTDLDENLIPIIRKAIKVIIWLIAFIMIIDNFGYDVTSMIAGLGLGGLAFALAAQDLLANLFGGIAIFSDKPFKIGDRIRLHEKGTDGWVNEIGIRTTRVKTLDGTQLVIPNRIIADSILENVSKEKARKMKLPIGVEYATSNKKMDEAVKIIKRVIGKYKNTDDNLGVKVSFTEFGDSALNLLVIYYMVDTSFYFETQHDINMAIKKEFEKAKIGMAFPTRTVYMKKG